MRGHHAERDLRAPMSAVFVDTHLHIHAVVGRDEERQVVCRLVLLPVLLIASAAAVLVAGALVPVSPCGVRREIHEVLGRLFGEDESSGSVYELLRGDVERGEEQGRSLTGLLLLLGQPRLDLVQEQEARGSQHASLVLREAHRSDEISVLEHTQTLLTRHVPEHGKKETKRKKETLD